MTLFYNNVHNTVILAPSWIIKNKKVTKLRLTKLGQF